MNLFSFLKKKQTGSITVDFGKNHFYMPSGAIAVKNHRPAGAGVQIIQLSNLKLERIAPGQTGYQYLYSQGSQGKRPFCDALVIDELANLARKENSTSSLQSSLGSHRLIVFFGTIFFDANRNECVPFLNLSSALPAVRYLIGLNKPVEEHTVPCFAALL